MAGVLAEDRSEEAIVVAEHPVSAPGSCSAYPSLGVTVRPRRPRRVIITFRPALAKMSRMLAGCDRYGLTICPDGRITYQDPPSSSLP